VSRVWRKVKGDWDAWSSRSLADEPIVRFPFFGTVELSTSMHIAIRRNTPILRPLEQDDGFGILPRQGL
jgi:hypothetical protein